MKSTVEILGIPLFSGSIEDAIALVLETDVSRNRCISATGAHGLVHAKQTPSFADILHSFYLNLPDGMPGVWIGHWKGASSMRRCYGPDFFKEMMIASSGTSLKHYLCGGHEGVAEKLKEVCQNKFGNANIVGMLSPPFLSLDKYNYREIGESINLAAADIVWIGLSTPKQEQFASRLSSFTRVKYIIAVGAAFDFHVGNVQQAPKWIQQLGMEWLFRLTREPRRLWKRYVTIVPLFIYYNFTEFITGKFLTLKRL